MYYSSVNLSRYNTLSVPAIARWFITIDTPAKLDEAIQFAHKSDLEILALGGGSNIVFAENFNGLVMYNNLMGKEVIEEDDESVVIQVGSGENWHDLVMWTLEKKWYGLENLALIPGSVGAAPIQNIGAYGVEFKEVFESLDMVEYKSGRTKTITLDDCKFAYRDSVFKTKLLNKVFITQVFLRLSKQPQDHSDYPTLKNYLKHHRLTTSPEHIFKAICAIRRTRLPAPEKIPNAGSFFKNPVVSEKVCTKLQKEYPNLVSFPEGDKKFKISAGYLIEQAGWKGYRYQGVGMHSNQALVLTNNGKRPGKEILTFAKQISDSVKQQFDIELEMEPQVYPRIPTSSDSQ